MLGRAVLVTVSLLLATTSPSSAQPRPRRVIIITDEPELPAPAVRVDAEVGPSIGVSAVTIAVSYPIVHRFAVEFGAGYGYSGVQVSLMGRVPWGRGPLRFIPGLGVSGGFPLGTRTFNRGHPTGHEDDIGRGVLMRWLDADLLAVEYRRGRLQLTASAGVTVALRNAHVDLDGEHEDISFGTALPQVRLGIGRVF